jgi:16S rRNA (adenine1518-N6/adenine1519-N6)-dimethyltransferase
MKKRGARLGQHFLTGAWAARKLVGAADTTSTDTVLEIGPGKGALTKELLKTGAYIIAIEKDEGLARELRTAFASAIAAGALTIIEGDVRDFDPASCNLQAAGYILAANIPYYITGEIIRQFLSTSREPKTMALLVQKEVAERIVARNGKESILSISVKAYGEPEIVAKVSKGNFNPPPSVDSAILVVRNISKKLFHDFNEAFFFKVVRTGFSSKRKFLLGNLAKEFGRARAEQAFTTADLHERIRAEDVSLVEWGKIAANLTSYLY